MPVRLVPTISDGRVDHAGVAVVLDDRAVLDVGAESQVNRLGVGREAIGRDLDDRLVAVGLEGVCIAGVAASGTPAGRQRPS